MLKMEHIDVIISLIQGVGFPIFVAVYLLIYMKREIELQRTAMTELKMVLISLTEIIKKRGSKNE